MRPGTIRLVLAIFAGCVSVAEAKNAVFIIVDDLRPKLGCYGDAAAISPCMDKLAKDSTLFSRAYCQYPVCNPSRSSFLSGMRPDSTGVYGNEKQALSPVALKDVLVMNRHFANSGFEVAGFGKVYHDGVGPEGGWTRPFVVSKWLDYVRPENKAIGDNYFSPKRPKDQKMPSSWEAEDVPDDAYCDGIVAREAVQSLKELAEQKKPFLLLVGFRHPHMPWCAPKKYWDLYDRESLPTAANRNFPEGAPEVALNRFGELWSYANTPDGPLTEALQKQSVHAYYACMSYVDAQVGKVISALKELNLYEDTVIVLISDNGYQMGDNGTWCKEVNWEATNRIVCMLRAPGHGQPGQVLDNLVELVDVYPTLCAASGIPIPKHCEGKSLLPLVDDPKAPWTDIAFSQFRRGEVMGRSIRTERYRFTLWERGDGDLVGRELYDLKADPQGNVNVAEHPGEQARALELTKLLQEKWPASHKVSRSTRSQEVFKASKNDPPLE